VDYYVSRRYRRKTLKPLLKKTFTVEKILMDRNYSSSTVERILLEITIEELHVVIIIGDKLLLSLNVCVNKVLPKNFFCGPSKSLLESCTTLKNYRCAITVEEL
jgi:hypothetical protein